MSVEKYKVYAENMDGERRFIANAIADNGVTGLFNLYADECGDEEKIVIMPVTFTDKAQELAELAVQNGSIQISSGAFLESQENIIADQANWADEDSAKQNDFTIYPFWVTTDDGQEPQGISDIVDLADWLKKSGQFDEE